MKNVLLVGASLNSGNRGVNALTRGQIMLLLDIYSEEGVQISILSYTVDKELVNEVEYRGNIVEVREMPCNKKESISAYLKGKVGLKSNFINIINNVDIILDISEGDSFSDIYGIKRFIQHSIVKLIAIDQKKKLVIMPQTLGPFKRKWVKVVAKKILDRATSIYVRDEISKNIIIEKLNVKRQIELCPDMAFYMKKSNEVSIDKFIEDKKNNIVGINVSALLYNGGYNENNMFGLKVNYKELVDNLISQFANMSDVDIILIPHVITDLEIEDDLRVCKKLSDNLSDKIGRKVYTLDKGYREDELKGIISGCDFFIGSRMHACIGAISTLVPTISMAYSRKFLGVWERLNLQECVMDLKELDEEDIITKVLKAFKDRQNIKEVLVKEIPSLENKIFKTIKKIEEN